jgi:hypothetical protein
MTDPIELLRAQLNGETGQLSWQELERHFARGVVIRVARSLDLVTVAACIAQDDAVAVERWMNDDLIGRATSAQALDWQQRQVGFWAVVTAPWVLVQEVGPTLNA